MRSRSRFIDHSIAEAELPASGPSSATHSETIETKVVPTNDGIAPQCKRQFVMVCSRSGQRLYNGPQKMNAIPKLSASCLGGVALKSHLDKTNPRKNPCKRNKDNRQYRQDGRVDRV